MPGTDDFVVFERFIAQESEKDSLFVRLTCDKDNELQYVRVRSINFASGLRVLSPIMVIDFVDGTGDFFNHNRLDTEAQYTLFFGRTIDDATQITFKIADIQYQNGVLGRSIDIHFQVIFAHENWEGFSAEKKTRGWRNKLYTEAVSDIVTNKGFVSVDIEPSQRLQKSILQTSVTDARMLRYLAATASPVSGDGHYEYATTLDNRFFFLSTGELIKRGVAAFNDGSMATLRLGGQPPRIAREQNEAIPVGFLGFSGEESYMSRISNGGSSIEYGYYDWEKRSYVRNVSRFQDLPISQLSEWSLLRDQTDFVSKKIFGGRDTGIDKEANTQISSLALSMQAFHINVEGQHEIQPGDIIELIIPNDIEFSVTPFNELYSGFYMVTEVKHQMYLHTTVDFGTQLSITRHGMDQKSMSGYLKSSTGKASFNA